MSAAAPRQFRIAEGRMVKRRGRGATPACMATTANRALPRRFGRSLMLPIAMLPAGCRRWSRSGWVMA